MVVLPGEAGPWPIHVLSFSEEREEDEEFLLSRESLRNVLYQDQGQGFRPASFVSSLKWTVVITRMERSVK